jgi:hypothetical protein
MQQSETYRVVCSPWEYYDFGRFEDAAAKYASTKGAHAVINMDRYDGAPDAGNEWGLTEAQREVLGL